jgi:hypothetical protein
MTHLQLLDISHPNCKTMSQALTTTDLQGALPLVARGKVRDLYEIDDKTLLFVATDRISAYDVIMENVHALPPIQQPNSNRRNPPA